MPAAAADDAAQRGHITVVTPDRDPDVVHAGDQVIRRIEI
jgi:hypothetical protein